MDDEYACAARGKLKLKKDVDLKKKKKKSKNKEKEHLVAEQITASEKPSASEESYAVPERRLTKAEISFKKMQEKMQKEKIKERAAMTHKERVEKFNQHLDSLTEHFDIPKVSWTK